MRVGLDIGSTTIKCVVLDEHDALLYSTYERHYSHILEKAQELLRRIDAVNLITPKNNILKTNTNLYFFMVTDFIKNTINESIQSYRNQQRFRLPL